MSRRRYAEDFGESLRSYNASDCGADLNFAIIQSSSSSGVSSNPKSSISSEMQSCSSSDKTAIETDTDFSSANSCVCTSTIKSTHIDCNVTVNNLVERDSLEKSLDLNKRINLFEKETDDPKENEDPNQQVITDQDTNYNLGRNSLRSLNSSTALENKQNQLNEFVKKLETCKENFYVNSPESVLKKVSLEFHRTSPERFTDKLRTILEESIVDPNNVNSTGVSLHRLTQEFKKMWRIEDESMPELVTSVFDVTSMRSPTRKEPPYTPTFKITDQGKKIYKKTPVNVFKKKLIESPREKANMFDSFEFLENLLKQQSPLRRRKSMSVETLYGEHFRKSKEASEKIKLQIQLQIELLNDTTIQMASEDQNKRQLKKWHSEFNLSKSSNFQAELEKSLKAEFREREKRWRETKRLMSEIERQGNLELQKNLQELPEISGIVPLGVSSKQNFFGVGTSSARKNDKFTLTVSKKTSRRSISPKPGGAKGKTVPRKTPQSTKVSVRTPNIKTYGSSTKLGVPNCVKSNVRQQCERTPGCSRTPGSARKVQKGEDQLPKEKTKSQIKYFSSTGKSPTCRRKPVSYFDMKEKQGTTPRRLLDDFKSVVSPVRMYIHNSSPTLQLVVSPKRNEWLLTPTESKNPKTPSSGKKLPFNLGPGSLRKAENHTPAKELQLPEVVYKPPLKIETVNKTPKVRSQKISASTPEVYTVRHQGRENSADTSIHIVKSAKKLKSPYRK